MIPFLPPQRWDYRHAPLHQAFFMAAGNWTPFFMLVWQALYPHGHLKGPSFGIIECSLHTEWVVFRSSVAPQSRWLGSWCCSLLVLLSFYFCCFVCLWNTLNRSNTGLSDESDRRPRGVFEESTLPGVQNSQQLKCSHRQSQINCYKNNNYEENKRNTEMTALYSQHRTDDTMASHTCREVLAACCRKCSFYDVLFAISPALVFHSFSLSLSSAIIRGSSS